MKDAPWLPDAAYYFLRQIIEEGDITRVFEWGVGGTTKLLNEQFPGAVITIEHDPKYIREYCQRNGLSPDLRYVPLGATYPQQIASEKDLIVIDGRMRVACFKEAMKWVSVGGWIVLDNSDRERYREVFDLVPKGWLTVRIKGPGDGGVWETAFFQKVCDASLET